MFSVPLGARGHKDTVIRRKEPDVRIWLVIFTPGFQ